jgi:hypothetical protein
LGRHVWLGRLGWAALKPLRKQALCLSGHSCGISHRCRTTAMK